MFKVGMPIKFLGFVDDFGMPEASRSQHIGETGVIMRIGNLGKYSITILLDSLKEDYLKERANGGGYYDQLWDVRTSEINPIEIKLDLERFM